VCKFKQGCPHIKYYYRGDVANDNASDRLVVARRGTRLSKGELLNIEEIITPGIRKGKVFITSTLQTRIKLMLVNGQFGILLTAMN